jgi:ABC-2 type transport system ATP-binding protein
MPNAYPELTVRENLEVFRRLRSPLEPKAVDFAIERLGLERYADRPASTLSLGNAQRLGLAKALLHKPQLLILDEPSNGLDPAGIVEVRNLLNELSTEHGVTVFLSSHLLGEVARLATRIGIIHNGRLLTERNVNEVERERRTRLVCSTRADEIAVRLLAGAGFDVTMNGDGVIEVHNPLAHEHPDQVARVLVDLGYPPTMLKVEREDLETYFLRLVGMEDRHAGEKR